MKILCTRSWEFWEKEALLKADPNATFLEPHDKLEVEDLVNEADILYGFPDVPLDVIASSPTLKLMHVPSTGVDRYVSSPSFVKSRVILTNSRGVHAKPVAEHAFALMLSLAYKFRDMLRIQERSEWKEAGTIRLEGLTAGLLGTGAIGEEIARKCKAFDMKVLGVRRNPSSLPSSVDSVYPPSDMDEVLRRSDFVLCSLPLTEETKHSLDYRRFSVMKPSAFFVNVGRGAVVKEEDLVRALKEGKIAGAGLDVFETEPLPPSSPLWKMDNVVVTPHVGGHFRENNRRSLAILVENIKRLKTGEPLVNVVDKVRGY